MEKTRTYEVVQAQFASYAKLFEGIEIISSADIAALLDNDCSSKSIILVDVRTDAERGVSSLPQAISEAEFEATYLNSQTQNIPDTLVVPFCTIGYRSGKYCMKLKSRGINCKNGEGVVLWTYTGRPLVKTIHSKHGLRVEDTLDVHTFGSAWNGVDSGYTPVVFSPFELWAYGLYYSFIKPMYL